MDRIDENEILIVIRTGAMETSKHLEEGDVIETLVEALQHFCECAGIPAKTMLAYFDSKNTNN